MIAFDLTATFRVARSTEYQFYSVFLCFSFEDLGDKLFSIIKIDFTWDPSRAECPTKSVNR